MLIHISNTCNHLFIKLTICAGSLKSMQFLENILISRLQDDIPMQCDEN